MPILSPWMHLSASCLIGLMAGSFLNVCIYRLPRGESVAWPGSHCPLCQAPIAWYDNLPVLSYMLLRGKCRHCHAPISWRYPVIETVNALLWLWATLVLPLPTSVLACLLGSALLTLACIDQEHLIIPDSINLFIAVLGLIAFFVSPSLLWWERLLGGLVGGGSLLLLAELAYRLWHKDAMGGGDIKLMAAAGLFLGWKQILLALFLSSFIALGFILIEGIVHRRASMDTSREIPYGPALACACWLSLLYGDTLIRAYLNFILH